MRGLVLPVLVVATCALAGCDRLTAAFAPAHARITQAFPLPDEIVLAHTRMQEAAGRDSEAGRLASDAFDNLVRVRALTCTASAPIGRFDTPADIRRKIADPECFRQQDAQLADWIGLRRIDHLLTQPSLRPMTALAGARLLPALKNGAVGVTAAEAANVLVFNGNRGKYTAVDLPQGNVIRSFEVADAGYTGLSLSPNGRVFIVPLESNRGLQAVDVESGSVLWTSAKYNKVVAWLPTVHAMVMASVGDESAAMLDTRQGKATPYPLAEKRPSWAVTMPGAANRLLVGGYDTATLMEHTRNADGAIEIQPQNQWRLTKRVTSAAPMLMGNGARLVYVTTRDLAWIDLATGNQGVWETSALNGNGYAKIGEQAIFFSSTPVGSPASANGRVIDIEQQTLATVPGYTSSDGLILPLTPRAGYVRRGHELVSIGADVTTGAVEDLQKAIANSQVEQQLAKLKAQSAMQDSAGRDPRTDALQTQAMLTNVPDNAQVAIVGVYEGKSSAARTGSGPRAPGSVRINVLPSSTPLVLVLSSYEPVRWHVQNAGRKISAVLLSSYGESDAFGVDGAPVLKIGSAHAYSMDSPDYVRLKRDISRYVKNPVRSFQGSYSGQDFSVSAFN